MTIDAYLPSYKYLSATQSLYLFSLPFFFPNLFVYFGSGQKVAFLPQPYYFKTKQY